MIALLDGHAKWHKREQALTGYTSTRATLTYTGRGTDGKDTGCSNTWQLDPGALTDLTAGGSDQRYVD